MPTLRCPRVREPSPAVCRVSLSNGPTPVRMSTPGLPPLPRSRSAGHVPLPQSQSRLSDTAVPLVTSFTFAFSSAQTPPATPPAGNSL